MNPWAAVDETRWHYQQTIAVEHRANDMHASHGTDATLAAWREAMRKKSEAWLAYRNARREALKSGVLMPCDNDENG